MARSKVKNSAKPSAGEVYIEFFALGNAVKVSAVDAATGVEVAVMGPKSATRDELQRLAVRKLNNKLQADT